MYRSIQTLRKRPIKFPSSFHFYSSRGFCRTRVLMSDSLPKDITIPVPSGYIAGKVWNEGGSTPILGLHGWMDNAGTWDEIAPLLPKSMSLVSLDFPGHGLSPLEQTGGSTFLDLVLVVERVVQHFGWQEVNILGHSMGGGVAFLYAATFPKKVKKIIMIDLIKPVSLQPENQPSKTLQSIQELLLAEKKLSSKPPCYDYDVIVDRMIKGYNESLTVESAKTLLKRGSQQQENGQYSFSYDPRIRVRNLLSLTFEQQKAFAQQLECEMLLIKASEGPYYEDKALYNEMIEIYKEKTKSFKYVNLKGSHHVHMNDPNLVAPVICDFLTDGEL